VVRAGRSLTWHSDEVPPDLFSRTSTLLLQEARILYDAIPIVCAARAKGSSRHESWKRMRDCAADTTPTVAQFSNVLYSLLQWLV
jgi:hypothetical protein